MHNIEEAHDIGVLHLLEQRDFADGRAGHALIFGLEADLFQRDYATAVGEIASFVYDTIGACDAGSMAVSLVFPLEEECACQA